jgi:hypothetical protein
MLKVSPATAQRRNARTRQKKSAILNFVAPLRRCGGNPSSDFVII